MDIRTSLSIIPEPRIERRKKHLLVDILLLCIIAMICGVEDIENIASFGSTHLSLAQIVPGPAQSHPQHRHYPAQKGDYILALKENHPEVYAEVRDLFDVVPREPATPKLPQTTDESRNGKRGWIPPAYPGSPGGNRGRACGDLAVSVPDGPSSALPRLRPAIS
jgi:hypothetical protein